MEDPLHAGAALRHVSFSDGVLQLAFDRQVFQIFNAARLCSPSGKELKLGASALPDAIASLIGRIVTIGNRNPLTFVFSDGARLIVGSDDIDIVGPEAWTTTLPSGELVVEQN